MLPAHQVTKEATELLDSSTSGLSVWNCCSCRGELDGVVWGFELPPCVKSQVLTFGRSTRPTLFESFFVVRHGEHYQVRTLGSQPFSLRDRCGEHGAPLGPHAWGQP